MDLNTFKQKMVSGVKGYYFDKFSYSYDQFDRVCMYLDEKDSLGAKAVLTGYMSSVDSLTAKINLLKDTSALDNFHEVKFGDDNSMKEFVASEFGVSEDEEKYALISALYSI